MSMIKKEKNGRLLYIPATVSFENNDYCYCGMSKSTGNEKCHICVLPAYQHVEISCKEGKEQKLSRLKQ